MLQRGVVVSDQTIRQWCATFGQVWANRLRRRRARAGDTWRLDEVVIEDQRQDPRPVVRGRPARQCARRPGAVTPTRGGRHKVRPPCSRDCGTCRGCSLPTGSPATGPAHRVVMPAVEHRQSKYQNQSGRERASASSASSMRGNRPHTPGHCGIAANLNGFGRICTPNCVWRAREAESIGKRSGIDRERRLQ